MSLIVHFNSLNALKNVFVLDLQCHVIIHFKMSSVWMRYYKTEHMLLLLEINSCGILGAHTVVKWFNFSFYLNFSTF